MNSMMVESETSFPSNVSSFNASSFPAPEVTSLEVRILELVFYIVSKYLWMVVVIVGIPGNLISLAISLKEDNKKISTCTYMAALACADTQKLIVTAWAYSVMFWTKEYDVWHIRIIWYIGYTAGILSGFFLMEMSMDRLMAVRFPMSAKTKCTTTKAMRTILASVVVVAIINVHILLTYGYEEDQNSEQRNVGPKVPENPIIEQIILAFHLSFGTLVPFFIIVCCNIWIILTLRSASMRRSQMGVDEKMQKAQDKEKAHLTRMLILVCLAYVVTSIPYRMYDLVIAIPPIQKIYVMKEKYWHVRYTTQHWSILHFWEWNYGINFYLYCIGGGKKYRGDVKVLMKKLIRLMMCKTIKE